MKNEYFDIGSTGSKVYFEDKEEDTKKLAEEKAIKDFMISSEKYKKAEVSVETIKYEIKD